MLLMGAGTLSAQAQTYFEPAAKRCGHADGIAEECVAVNGYCNACTPGLRHLRVC